MKRSWRAAITLALGAAGAGVGSALGVPAAGLVAPALTVGAAAVLRARVTVPDRVRDLAFAIIGISIGANVSGDALAMMGRWPASLAALVVCLVGTTLVSSEYLARVRGWDRGTALLSSTPGALSTAIALASQGHGDARVVSLSQTVRLMSLTVGLPLLLGSGGAAPHPGGAMSFPMLGVLLAGTAVAGGVLERLRVPTPLLIGGMIVTAGAHLCGIAPGGLPPAAAVPAFVVTGSYAGARFAGVTWRELWSAVRSSFVLVAITTAGSALFAAWVAHRLRVPFPQAWIAFAPGGAETMTAMAIALGYDQTYISSHHIFRILLLSAFLPVVLARAARSPDGTGPAGAAWCASEGGEGDSPS